MLWSRQNNRWKDTNVLWGTQKGRVIGVGEKEGGSKVGRDGKLVETICGVSRLFVTGRHALRLVLVGFIEGT
jgi:hypothetical protein